ncbi:MAG: deoxyribodipyrimidine photo-lyase [Pseudomonadota bacterium]
MPVFDTTLVWLRRDLRLNDQAAFYHALKASRSVIPVFIFDTDILDTLPHRADRRVEFIWESLNVLKLELEALGSSLITRYGRACELIPQLAQELNAQAVFCNRDYEPAAMARDAEVAEQLSQNGRELCEFKDQVIFETDEVLTQVGKPFSVFTPYKNAWLKKLDTFYHTPYPVARYLDRLARLPPQVLISLEEMGFSRTRLDALGIQAGSAGAQRLFENFVERIDHYKAMRDFPALKGPSFLSVHLRFGTVSIRQLVTTAHGIGSPGANTWLSELIWREFYQQVLWHHPRVAAGYAYKPEFDAIVWPNPAGHFEAWCEARTGYPLVDAAMRQLNQTGTMHNRLRMVAASFLVKDLHVDWRLGERYFAARLIDFDLAANNGGWQWAASTGCDAQPWFRIFNPIVQSQKFDAEGTFIKRYVPELGNLPAKHIHAPWLLTAEDQQAYGMTLGHDYPAPIVEHASARTQTLALYKAAVKN